MARKPHIAKAKYQSLVDCVAKLGYNTNKLKRVTQQPLAKRIDLKAPSSQ